MGCFKAKKAPMEQCVASDGKCFKGATFWYNNFTNKACSWSYSLYNSHTFVCIDGKEILKWITKNCSWRYKQGSDTKHGRFCEWW
jgi:hypothetical protein